MMNAGILIEEVMEAQKSNWKGYDYSYLVKAKLLRLVEHFQTCRKCVKKFDRYCLKNEIKTKKLKEFFDNPVDINLRFWTCEQRY